MIFNITGGGAGMSGAQLTVNAPAGAVVTVSKDGKSKTKTAGADGVVVFKGLETGDWTCNMVSADGTQTMQPRWLRPNVKLLSPQPVFTIFRFFAP